MPGWIVVFDLHNTLIGGASDNYPILEDILSLLIYTMTQRDIYNRVSCIFLQCRYNHNIGAIIDKLTRNIFKHLIKTFPLNSEMINLYKEPFDNFIFTTISLPGVQLTYNQLYKEKGDIRKRILFVSSKAHSFFKKQIGWNNYVYVPYMTLIREEEIHRALLVLQTPPNQSPLRKIERADVFV